MNNFMIMLLVFLVLLVAILYLEQGFRIRTLEMQVDFLLSLDKDTYEKLIREFCER